MYHTNMRSREDVDDLEEIDYGYGDITHESSAELNASCVGDSSSAFGKS